MFNFFVKYLVDTFTFLYLKFHGVEAEYGDVKMYGFPLIVKAKGSRIILRKGTTLISNSRFNPAGINHCVILATMTSTSVIEIDGAGISGGSIVSVKSIFIGRGSGLGANSNIYDTDFHILNPKKRASQKDIESAKSEKVSIGKNVWISSGINILKGVSVGDGAVIGCGSVVLSDVEQNCLYAGVPAKKIRDLVSNEK